MKEQNQIIASSCGIHPIEFIEGVCPLCLNERLLVLASIQKLQHPSPPPSYHTIQKPKFSFQKSSKKKNNSLFSFLGSFDLRHHKFDQQTNSTSSPEGTIYQTIYFIHSTLTHIHGWFNRLQCLKQFFMHDFLNFINYLHYMFTCFKRMLQIF